MKAYKCIIWDWNGTLLDDVSLNIGIVNTLLRERGLEQIRDIGHYRREFTFPVIDFYRQVGFDLEGEDFTLIAREYARLFDQRYPQAEIFGDVCEALSLIKHSGLSQLILSASEQGYLLRQVEYFELDHYFTDILGVRDVLGSSKLERARLWMAEAGFHGDEVLLIGDTGHDAETAEAIGCDCVLVSRGHYAEERLRETGCRVYENLGFIKDLVKK